MGGPAVFACTLRRRTVDSAWRGDDASASPAVSTKSEYIMVHHIPACENNVWAVVARRRRGRRAYGCVDGESEGGGRRKEGPAC